MNRNLMWTSTPHWMTCFLLGSYKTKLKFLYHVEKSFIGCKHYEFTDDEDLGAQI